MLRQKPKKSSQSNESGADQVFTHRTSREEELAIVTHKRLSTDDDEVAVKFEVWRKEKGGGGYQDKRERRGGGEERRGGEGERRGSRERRET